MNKDWLDIGVLEDYLDGKLDAKTMNRVEREALEDPFVAEALAGLSESPRRSLQSLSLLQKQLHERVAEHQAVKKTSVITWQRLSIAATAAVMFVAVSIMFWMRENNHQQELASQAKKVDVNIAPQNPVRDESAVAAVQAAPVVASESADQVKEKEIDKAIKAAKTNTYAARVKKKAELAVPAPAPQQLNDVVIVGYGTQRKESLIGAVVTAAPAQANISRAKVGDSIFNPGDQSLNEVVAFGYAKAKKNQAETAKVNNALQGRMAGVQIRGVGTLSDKKAMVSNPVEGWDKLWAYLELNNAFKSEKKTGQTVEVSFRIDKGGSPVDIRIDKGADEKYEQEAIRLILNGPKWEKPEKRRSRMTFKIDF